MYTTLRTEQKMTADPDAPKEENYYNSESEGKEYKDFDEKYEEHIHATYEDYKASPFFAPEEYGTWDIYHKDNTEAP